MSDIRGVTLRRAAGLWGVAWLLLGAYPAAADPGTVDVDRLLDRTGKAVVRFLDQLGNVKCTESVSQEKLGKSDKAEYEELSTFDYLVLAQASYGDLSLVESRQAEVQPKHKKDLPLLVTNGFSTLLLVFHPFYQPSFEFTALGDEVIDGRPYARLHFRHIKGMVSTTALLLRNREYPLDMEGTAWIDKDSGTVVKITAALESSLSDLGLKSLRSEVTYAPVAFADSPEIYWLPASASIEVETPRQHWRNVHRFTAYQRFSTSVKSTLGEVR